VVAINARAAVRREIGGVERVARAMAAELPGLRPDRYRVIRPPRALAHRAGHAWEQGWLPLAARGATLIYSPANLAPLGSRRNVVVIHDVAPLRHPEWYGRAYVGWQRALLPRLARRARMVIAVSEFARGEIASVLGVSREGVEVVPNGVDDRFSPAADPEPARLAHRLEGPYALAVGTRIARKNLPALERAARSLHEAGIELVAAGSGRGYMRAEEPGSDRRSDSTIAARGEQPGVRPLGYVAEDLLPGLYAGARALAMPSLYEGFGLPCLEAMACGTPVVAADRGALPETCGGAALLVDPGDGGALAEALLAATTDESQRGRLIEAGRERAAGFTWRRAAERTDDLIGKLLSPDAPAS
jgi:glycosyltransferase involved in cell wall biosynthesis